jgi:hypothetical protein
MSKSTTIVVLEGPRNWDLWIYKVQRLAEAADVWEYINPALATVPELSKPERPARPDPAADADAQAQAQYTRELSLYNTELKEYRRTKDKLSQIKAHVADLMAQDLIYQIKDKPTLYEQLKALRDLIAPSQANREYQVQKAYNSAKVLHADTENLEDWAIAYLSAYNRAREINLPEVSGFRPHKDLIRAIKQVDSGYAATMSIKVFEAEASQPTTHATNAVNPTLPELLSTYLRYYRTTYTVKTSTHGGIFAATLNQQESLYKRKRSLEDDKPSKPCLCGDQHFWGQCPYIDKNLRESGFVEDPEKAKKVAAYEAKDSESILSKIRQKNQRYKRQKESTSKGSDSNSTPDSIEIDAGDDPAFQHTFEAYQQ